MAHIPLTALTRTLRIFNRPSPRFPVLLIWLCLTCSGGMCNAQSNPTLYFHWRPGADAYDNLTLTVKIAVDSTTPNGSYSIRSEQTTNSSNFANHDFTVTNGVASSDTFTVVNYPIMGSGPTGILLWVNAQPTSAFNGVTQVYHYTDGGAEPDYFSHHDNAAVGYTDLLTFHLDTISGVESLQGVQAVPEPATWFMAALTCSTVVVMATRGWRRRECPIGAPGGAGRTGR